MRWVLVLLLAASVVIAVWRFAQGDDALAPGPAVRAPAPRAVPAGTATEPALELSTQTPPGPGRAEGALERAAVEGPARTERGGDFELHVVLAESGEPIPGAQVTFLDRRANPEWVASWSEPTTRLQFVRTNGRLLEADPQGLVRVPMTDSGAVSARLSGHYGELEWNLAPREALRLEVYADSDLRVRVLDERGLPRSGVPVVLMRDRDGVGIPMITRQTVGAEAIAAFPRVRQLLGAGATAVGGCSVTLGFPCALPPRLVIDTAAPPTEVVDLRMPSTGRLVVHVVDETGQPLQSLANVTLGATLGPNGEPIQQGATTQRLVGGRASFPFVGVGARFQVRLDGAAERPPKSEPHDGPTRPGEEKEIRLTWGDRYPSVSARAVDSTGAPLSQRRGRYFLWSGAQVNGGPVLATDGSGRFTLVVDRPLAAEGGRRVEATLFAATGGPPLEARIDLGFDLSGTMVELGDVVFVPAAALASGRVVDAAGAPLFGVHVRAELPSGDGEWAAERNLASSTDRDGAFAIYGRSEARTLRLVAFRQGFEEARTPPVAPGTGGLEITLRRAP